MRSREASLVVDELHRRGGVPWPSERRLLKLLLRFVRDETGHVGMQWSTRRLAAESDTSYRGIEDARRRLVRAGLVEIVRPGSGRLETLYRVALERLPMEVLAGLVLVEAVNPGEKAGPPASSTPPRSPWGRPTVTVGQTPDHAPPYARVRIEPEIPDLKAPLSPTRFAAGGSSPPTVKGSTSCPRAKRRGRPCENCRACHTTQRQLTKAARAAAKLAEVERRKADQIAKRREFEAGRAAAAAPLPSGRTRYEEWQIEQHLRDLTEAEEPINERETG